MFRGRVIATVSLVVLAISCSKRVELPPVATVTFSASPQRVAIGSPVELTYQFDVLPGAAINGDYLVFVHVLHARGDIVWTDDHEPPIKTSQWKPGQIIGPYTRTLFIPPFDWNGRATVVLGLYKPGGDERLTLAVSANEPRFARVQEFKVAELEILPSTDSLRLGSGWYDLGGDPAAPADQARWTQQSATVTLRNPKRDVTFYLDASARPDAFPSPQMVTIVANGQPVTMFAADKSDRTVHRIPISASQLGSGDIVEIRIDIDRTFNPSKLPVANRDDRDLGLLVYNVFVEPK